MSEFQPFSNSWFPMVQPDLVPLLNVDSLRAGKIHHAINEKTRFVYGIHGHFQKQSVSHFQRVYQPYP